MLSTTYSRLENTGHENMSILSEAHKGIECEFMPLMRGDDDDIVLDGDEIPIQHGDAMPADFGGVTCMDKFGQVFENLVSGISFNQAARTRERNFAPNASRLNVLMFGFDSVSRMTWMRNLPKTHAYMVNTLGGVVSDYFAVQIELLLLKYCLHNVAYNSP